MINVTTGIKVGSQMDPALQSVLGKLKDLEKVICPGQDKLAACQDQLNSEISAIKAG
jgi:hypothetical protein